jgi:hypothetical protein
LDNPAKIALNSLSSRWRLIWLRFRLFLPLLKLPLNPLIILEPLQVLDPFYPLVNLNLLVVPFLFPLDPLVPVNLLYRKFPKDELW